MRLALSGASNCGKTTLVNDLADALELEVIPEFLGSSFNADEDLRPAEARQRLQSVLQNKSDREASLPNGFISDRGPIDLAYIWFKTGMPAQAPRLSSEFIGQCRERASNYDAVIFPPGPSPESGMTNYFGKPNNIWDVWRNHSAMIGLALQWCPRHQVFIMPSHLETREQRVEWVLVNCVQPKSLRRGTGAYPGQGNIIGS